MSIMMHGQNSSSHTMTTTRGGSCLFLIFGIPLTLMGIIVFILGFGFPGADRPPLIMVLLLGPLFMFTGIWMVFGRVAVTIERNSMKLIRWWGLLRPFLKREYSLAGYDSVHAYYRERAPRIFRSSEDVWLDRWVVTLRRNGRHEIDVSEFARPIQAWSLAAQIADLLEIELVDKTK